MTILADLLPGVRHLRTPLTCGLLLSTLVYLFLYQFREDRPTTVQAHDLWVQVQDLPSIVQLSGTIFVSYMIGIAWVQFLTSLNESLRWMPKRFAGLILGLLRSRRPLRRILIPFIPSLRRDQKLAEDGHVEWLIRETVHRNLKTGSGKLVADLVPTRYVIDDFDHTAQGMANSDNVMYQELDRLQSEAQFRICVFLPVGLYAAVVPYYFSGWAVFVTIPLIVLVALAIIWSGFRATHEAGRQVAIALYQGLGSSPALGSLQDEMQNDEGEVQTIARFLTFMVRRAGLDVEGERELVGRFRHHIEDNGPQDVMAAIEKVPRDVNEAVKDALVRVGNGVLHLTQDQMPPDSNPTNRPASG